MIVLPIFNTEGKHLEGRPLKSTTTTKYHRSREDVFLSNNDKKTCIQKLKKDNNHDFENNNNIKPSCLQSCWQCEREAKQVHVEGQDVLLALLYVYNKIKRL